MTIKRRIFVSAPADEGLDDSQRSLKGGLLEEIKKLGYDTEGFRIPHSALMSGKQWHADEVDRVARRCVGAVILGLPLRMVEPKSQEVYLASEHAHFEGAVAYTLRLPILVLAEEGQALHGIFGKRIKHYVELLPHRADRNWLSSNEFQIPFDFWRREVAERRDIFLGYASSSAGTASNIKRYIESEVRATVLDWSEDFLPGGTILEQIQDAAARCSAGIFLFTKDDKLQGKQENAAPRDNVVFEAGFFVHAKGKERVLIVREKGSKLPADLGGNIYAMLDDRANIAPIQDQLRAFLEHRL